MGKIYNNLISTTAGFSYVAKQPLDDREVVQSYPDLNELVNSNATYDGIEVYVVDDMKSYKLIGDKWCAMATEKCIDEKINAQKYNVGDGLKLDGETNTITVNTTNLVEQDSTLPVTSAAVYELVGNINTLLETI